MARTRAAQSGSTPEYEGLSTEAEAAQYVEELRTATPGEAELDVVQGEYVEPDPAVAAAAKAAAKYVQERRFGAAMTQMVMYIVEHVMDTQDMNSVIVEQMALKILAAESPSDVLDPFGTAKGHDFYNKPLWVTGAQFLDSTVEGEGFPWYAMLNVQDPKSGEIVPTTVGGEKLVLKVAGLDMHGGWPCAVMITYEVSKKDPTRKIHDLVLPTAQPAF
jgi:hypothetical protein